MLVLTLKEGSVTQLVGKGALHIVEVRHGSVRVGFEDAPGEELNVQRENAKNKQPPADRSHRHIGHAG